MIMDIIRLFNSAATLAAAMTERRREKKRVGTTLFRPKPIFFGMLNWVALEFIDSNMMYIHTQRTRWLWEHWGERWRIYGIHPIMANTFFFSASFFARLELSTNYRYIYWQICMCCGWCWNWCRWVVKRWRRSCNICSTANWTNE